MKTYDIVLRLPKSVPHIRVEAGSKHDYQKLTNLIQAAIQNQNADVVYKGDYFRYDADLLPVSRDFDTFVLFREISILDSNDSQQLWKTLKDYLTTNNFLEVRQSDDTHQLIEFSELENNTTPQHYFNDDNGGEDVLVRIAGPREELEFDPLNDEANKMLYDKLTKQIYDREAEIMYKGPRLNFEDNRDLFINSDDFSVYVLFRTTRDYRYENNEMLWSNINNDLKVNSSITLYKTSEHYQVILIKELS